MHVLALVVVSSLLSIGHVFADVFAVSVPGNDLSFSWNITSTHIEMQLQGHFGVGWFAFGVNNIPAMPNTDVFWVKYDTLYGVKLIDAHTIARSTPAIDTSQDLELISTSVVGSVVTVRARRLLNTNDPKDAVIRNSTQYLMYSYRPGNTAMSFTSLSYHGTKRGAIAVDFFRGLSGADLGQEDVSLISASLRMKRRAHGCLMVISWGVLIPVGLVVARYKQLRWWLKAHIAIQCFGVLIGSCGVILGLTMVRDGNFHGRHKQHGIIGVSVFVLGLLNPLVAALRPRLKSRAEKLVWYVFHSSVGMGAIGMGLVNLFVGMSLYGVARGGVLWWLFVTWLLVVFVFVFVAELRKTPDEKQHVKNPKPNRQPK